MSAPKEGSLSAPTRHAINWKDASYWDEEKLLAEMERVFDICHGCRRCVSLCQSFPTLFDLVDESSTMEVDGVDKADYGKVVEHCYLCDLCFLTKCPYVPPHEWNLDFPHLMLQAKAINYKKNGASTRDKLLSNTDGVGSIASVPIVAGIVNASNKSKTMRKGLEKTLKISSKARLPEYHSHTFRKQFKPDQASNVKPAGKTTGKVAIFSTCYGNYNDPDIANHLVEVLRHNDIPVTTLNKEVCCGMPKLELGDFEAVEKAKQINIPAMMELINDGWDIIAPIPSCVLMFKQELPLLFANDEEVHKVKNAIYDPFEYLAIRHKAGLLKTDFKQPLGKVLWHVACHQRVQKIGAKTRDILQLVQDTKVETVERCSGHDGTYAVKQEYQAAAAKICRPVVNKVKKAEADYYTSDCIMAGEHIANGLDDHSNPHHPMTLLKIAYGI